MVTRNNRLWHVLDTRPSEVPPPSQIWLPCDIPSTTTLFDISGNDYDLAIAGPSEATDECFEITTDGNGAERNNVPGARDLPNTTTGWVKSEVRSDQGPGGSLQPYPPNAVSTDTPGEGGFGFGLNIWDNAGGGAVLCVPGTPFNLEDDWQAGRWYHVAVVCAEGGERRVYIDGELYNVGTMYDPSGASGDFFVGKHNNSTFYGSQRFHNGCIYDVRMWTQTLTQRQIKALYETTDPEGQA